jgi:hypothetical protein
VVIASEKSTMPGVLTSAAGRWCQFVVRAGEGIRTLDVNLGKVISAL